MNVSQWQQPELFPPAILAQFRCALRFVSIDPAKNRARFYTLHWQRSLWQEEALVQRWGRIGTPGRTRATFYAGREQAQELITRVIQHRLQHGYHIVEWR
jgi:predicted DNA-binding WGR domain protein